MKKIGFIVIFALTSFSLMLSMASFACAAEIDPNNGITEFVLQEDYYYALIVEDEFDGNSYLRFAASGSASNWITNTLFVMQSKLVDNTYHLYVLWGDVSVSSDLQTVGGSLYFVDHYIMQPMYFEGLGTGFNAVYQGLEATGTNYGYLFGAGSAAWGDNFVPGSGLYKFVLSGDVLPEVPTNDALNGVGQAVQGVIGWVGQVVPTITEYPGFIMMIAVPLCVGIVTWVTTIYKRRRG